MTTVVIPRLNVHISLRTSKIYSADNILNVYYDDIILCNLSKQWIVFIWKFLLTCLFGVNSPCLPSSAIGKSSRIQSNVIVEEDRIELKLSMSVKICVLPVPSEMTVVEWNWPEFDIRSRGWDKPPRSRRAAVMAWQTNVTKPWPIPKNTIGPSNPEWSRRPFLKWHLDVKNS